MDAIVGDEAQEGRLLELHSQTLPECPLKDGVARGVGKIGKHDRVFFTEDCRAMPEKPKCAGGDGKQEDHSDRNPSPRFRLLDLYLHLGMARANNTEFLLR